MSGFGARVGRSVLLILPALAGCAGAGPAGPSPAAPSLTRAEAEAILVQSLSCVDRDGFTLCLPDAQPRRVRLSRFECTPERPARWRQERARLTCAVAGTLTRASGREEPLPGVRADFFLFDGREGPYWETEGLYLERIPG